jgi:hypothetical protein
MGQWIKKNLVLVSGIVLPVLLVVGFFLVREAPRVLSDPPDYDFLLVAYRYDYQHPRDFHLSFETRDGILHCRVTPTGDQHTHMNRQYAGIFRYSAAENRFDEIPYDLPDGVEDLEEALQFAVNETRHLDLDKDSRSPDGFTFEYTGYRGRGGLLGEIFGMRNAHDNMYVLSKDGASFHLPRPTPNQYYNHYDVHFMGWIVAEDDSS